MGSDRPAAASGGVLLDLRSLQGAGAARGHGRYARELLRELVALPKRPPLTGLLDGGLPVPDLPPGLAIATVRRRYHGRLAAYEDAVALSGDLARIRPALFHALTLTLPTAPVCKVAVTVHDMIPWVWGGVRTLGERIRYLPGRRLLGRADLILAPSDASARDAARVARVPARRIRVVPEAAGPAFTPQPGAAERVASRWGIAGAYFLHVGALDPRKNPLGLLRAWWAAKRAGADVGLVLAGELGRTAARDLPGTTIVGAVTDAELADLYSAAACLLFPTRYEGFGLPVLEAMASGCPVAAFDNSSLPEVAGDAGVLVADGDAIALGRAAAALTLDAARRRRAVAAGLERARRFSWRRTARETVAAYDSLLS